MKIEDYEEYFPDDMVPGRNSEEEESIRSFLSGIEHDIAEDDISINYRSAYHRYGYYNPIYKIITKDSRDLKTTYFKEVSWDDIKEGDIVYIRHDGNRYASPYLCHDDSLLLYDHRYSSMWFVSAWKIEPGKNPVSLGVFNNSLLNRLHDGDIIRLTMLNDYSQIIEYIDNIHDPDGMFVYIASFDDVISSPYRYDCKLIPLSIVCAHYNKYQNLYAKASSLDKEEINIYHKSEDTDMYYDEDIPF